MESKRSGLRILAIAAGAFGAVAIAVLFWAWIAGSAKVDAARKRSQARLAEVKARDGARPPLRGAGVPGNAWDHYRAALEAVKKPGTPPDSALRSLSLGATRAVARYPYEWERGLEMPLPRLLDANALATLAVQRAKSFFDTGRSREAAGLLFDVLQFGRDQGSDGVLLSEMGGMGILGMGLGELKDRMIEGKLDAEAIEDVGRALEVLERTLPDHADTLRNEALLFAGLLDERMAGWGPQKLLMGDAAERLAGWMERAGKAEALPWAAAQSEYRALAAEAADSMNPMAKITAPSFEGPAKARRTMLARIRLLRQWALRKSGKEVPAMEDPFGAQLKSEGAKLWSVGPDGADDGGSGDWKGAGKDLVLE